MTRKTAPSTSKGWPAGKPLWQTPLPPDVPGAWFDQAAVDKVVRALRALRHTKGKWAGLPVELEPWQLEHIVGPIFGWKHPDGTRIIRTAWIEMPRKNGKSTVASGLALVLLCADGEQGAEVYSAAGSRPQAQIVFDEAKKMARATPALSKRLRLLAGTISVLKTGSRYQALSRIAEAAHGLNVSGAIVDEVHVHKSRHLIDAIETGTGARRQPLVIFLTTADDGDETTIYAEKHNYTVQLAKRVVSDPTFYGVIWAAEEADDPFDERTWRKANPGLGTTVSLDYIRQEAHRAKMLPAYLPTFLRLSLNRRVRSENRALNIADWDASAGLVVEDQLAGRMCYGGLDLASTLDIAAFVLVFPGEGGTYDLLCRFWTPAATIAERARRDQVPYQLWVDQGLMTATPGEVIEYAAIEQEIGKLGERFNIREIAYDRWGAQQMRQNLEGAGFTMVDTGQGYASMSAPTKELLKLVISKQLRHGGHPVLRWMADNLVVRTDAQGNQKPDREKSRQKIDGMVAAIMALDRATRHEEPKRSRWEDDGATLVTAG
jgi:phage terminase large subunit-like protein